MQQTITLTLNDINGLSVTAHKIGRFRRFFTKFTNTTYPLGAQKLSTFDEIRGERTERACLLTKSEPLAHKRWLQGSIAANRMDDSKKKDKRQKGTFCDRERHD